MYINEKISDLSLNGRFRFNKELLDVLENSGNYPAIYGRGNVGKINLDIQIAKEKIYKWMFE